MSRLDPSGADQIDAEHQATDLADRRACWPVPHMAVPFRSDMAAVVDGSAPAVQRGRCRSVRMPLPRSRASAVPERAGSRCRRPPPVSARPDSRYQLAASTWPARPAQTSKRNLRGAAVVPQRRLWAHRAYGHLSGSALGTRVALDRPAASRGSVVTASGQPA
jgi:hypothetical protein